MGAALLFFILVLGCMFAIQGTLLVRNKRDWAPPMPRVDENITSTKEYPLYVTTVVNDEAVHQELTYKITGEGVNELNPKSGTFMINKDGRIYLNHIVDREVKEEYKIEIRAYDNHDQQVDVAKDLKIIVVDINDESPVFDPTSLHGSLVEGTPAGTSVLRLKATDADKEDTNHVKLVYEFVNKPDENIFDINKETGIVTTRSVQDREVKSKYELVVVAKDCDGKISLCNVLITTATATIVIGDKNDNPPRFTNNQFQGSIKETILGPVKASVTIEDQDQKGSNNWKAVYSIISGDVENQFSVATNDTSNNPIISTIKPLDYEKSKEHTIVLKVENVEPLEGVALGPDATAFLTITVLNVMEPPEFTPSRQRYRIQEENKPNKIIGTVLAKDPDQPPKAVRFQVVDDPADWVSIDPNTGVLTAKKSMDRESRFVKNNTYTIKVSATKQGSPPMTSTIMVDIFLEDINDHSPDIQYNKNKFCLGSEKPVIINAVDKDTPPNTGPYTFSMEPRFSKHWKLRSIGYSEAEVRLVGNRPGGAQNISVVVKDQKGKAATRNVLVLVCYCEDWFPDSVCLDKGGSVGFGWDAIAAICFSLFALLLFGLLCCVFCCKKKKVQTRPPWYPSCPNGSTVDYNTEGGREVGDVKMTVPLNDNLQPFHLIKA
uniref:Cadherin domain-containing protein n=1 Tax=Eptatretus burgeri TaxID=7764 RepID=A0A8C4X252_EPTBU